MADIGTSATHQLSAPVLAVLPRTNWQLPKNATFWLVTVIFGLLLFSTSAPTPLYAVYQAHWHFSHDRTQNYLALIEHRELND